jgi:hypothetical protein
MTEAQTTESVASWMLSRVEQVGDLYQDDAVSQISDRFGEQFTHENESGNLAIAKPVLAAFRKLTGNAVVWERGERRWRKREALDDPGRQQE